VLPARASDSKTCFCNGSTERAVAGVNMPDYITNQAYCQSL
jgi:hypothetical protein